MLNAGRESGLQLSGLQEIRVDQNRRKLLNFAEKLRSEDGNKEVQGEKICRDSKTLLDTNGKFEHLEKAISTGKVSHAYIFSGEKGTGKLTLANAFAMALQCTGEGEKPCGTCHSCHQAASGNHPDIIHITHEKPNSIGVDDVRDQLVGDVQIRPYNGKYKIYIMPDAEKMTVQAQKCDLKDDRRAAGIRGHHSAHRQ